MKSPITRVRRSRVVRPSRLSAALAVGAVLAALALCRVSLVPPGLHARALNVAAASTTVLVDTRRSVSTDLGTRTDALEGLSAQADLVGETMVSDPVLAEIGRLTHIDPLDIQATAPITSDVPRVEIEPGSGANATSLIEAPDRYKLQVQVDPALPIIHVYTQAPSAAAAIRMANASVQGLRAYLSRLSTSDTVSLSNQIKLTQLGPARGGALSGHAPLEIALLAFLTGWLGTLFVVALAGRIRSGWTGSRTPARAQS